MNDGLILSHLQRMHTCIYLLRLPAGVIHFDYNNSEGANVMKRLLNEFMNIVNYTMIGNVIYPHLGTARSGNYN